jgi:alcohol dehydrogenase class IV
MRNFLCPWASAADKRDRLLGEYVTQRMLPLVHRVLRRAVTEGQDLEAREGMALAALLAGLAFSNVGVAVVHAMEYPVGGAVHCAHGRGNGLLLPYVMRFNLPARRREFAHIARLLGEDGTRADESAACERAISAVIRLRDDIGIPGRLRDLGVRQEQLPSFAERAFGIKRILRVNPRPVTVQDLEQIFHSAW